MTTNPPSTGWLSPQDLFLFNEGSHIRLYDKLGAHPARENGESGYHFAVWAPNAGYVSVVGDFNGWDRGKNPLHMAGNSGIWCGFIPHVTSGVCYKFHIANHTNGYNADKADPFAVASEIAPKQASVTWDLNYTWTDQSWLQSRGPKFKLDAPVSIYELHLGSWMRESTPPHLSLGYRGMAEKLAEYVKRMGFTHVEFMPLNEHPFYGSWGYQVTGYFAATSRFGTPQDLMYLIDTLHNHDIGVIIDWVPSHFATDPHALAYFDGTNLYEHADPRQGYHPDWGSYIFNYSRHEVRSFLLSSALFWLDKYHIDGIRVDAVASMLYLDYSRKDGDWIPNEYGGRENIGAIEFLRRFNAEVYAHYPDVQTIAEESTSWPMVSRPTSVGGLGFGYKWDMGWMHDTLKYCQIDPLYRKFHQNLMTFRGLYAFTENFVLPLSHDEVVHGKGPLFDKMAGDDWQKFATLRLLYCYQYTMTGKKLIFMGCEVAQRHEWKHDGQVGWHLLEYAPHRGVQKLVADLNSLYRSERALHDGDCEPGGFEWLDCSDADHSTFLYQRMPRQDEERLVVALNFTPEVRHDYRVGVPGPGHWQEIFNSDAGVYWGSNVGNSGGRHAEMVPWHRQPFSINITLPPLACVVFKGSV